MKNAKKLLGMVLSLCLVLSLLAGFTAAAAGEKNLLVNAGDWYYAATGENKPVTQAEGITIPLDHGEANANYQIHTPVLSVEPNTSYTLTFEYSLPAAQLEYIINACNAEGETDGYPTLVKWTTLDVNGEKYVNKAVSFTTGDAVTYMKVRFVTTNKGNTGSATVRYISVVKEEFKETNGSFEAVDGEGNVIGAAGTVVTDSDATPVFDGERMMVATKDKPVTLDLTLPESSENAKLRGYVKGVNFENSTATLTVKTAGGRALAEKSVNMAADDSIWDIAADTWDYVRMSGIPYSSGMELEISVTGEGSLYADGFTFEKDENLLKNAAFAPVASTERGSANDWKLTYYLDGSNNPDAFLSQEDGFIASDGNCPDGQYYVQLNRRNVNTKATTYSTLFSLSNITVAPGEKYLVSYWVKTPVTGMITQNTDGTDKTDNITTTKVTLEAKGDGILSKASYGEASEKLYSYGDTYRTVVSQSWVPAVINGFKETNKSTLEEWEQFVYIFTVPERLTEVNFQLAATYTDADHVVYFAAPRVEKLEEGEVVFYKDAVNKNGESFNGMVEPVFDVFMQMLGLGVDGGSKSDTYKAMYVTEDNGYLTDAAANPDEIVIMAAYGEENGTKKLQSIQIGNPASNTGKTFKTTIQKNIGTAETPDWVQLYPVVYPTVELDGTALDSSVTEIRAFAWDGVSGLKPAGNYATIKK